MASVAFFDSGVGGIAYLNNFLLKYPYSQHYYFADTEGFPYGVKSDRWLIDRLVRYAKDICKKKGVDIFVIACNTASVIALEEVRKTLGNSGIRVVGVVPAVKLAVDKGYKRIYVMGTSFTAASKYTKDLVATYAGTDTKIILRGIPELVELIEKIMMYSKDAAPYTAYISSLLDSIGYDILGFNSEVVVLACTHFLHIKNMLKDILGNRVAIIDSLKGVTNRIMALNNLPDSTQSLNIKKTKFFVTSNVDETVFQSFSQKNMLIYQGIWNIKL